MKRLCFTAALALALPACTAASSAPANSSVDANKAIARRLYEVALNKSNWDAFLKLHNKGFVAHGGGQDATLEEDLQVAKDWRTASSDFVYTLDRVVAEGDLVVVQATARGKSTGPLLGFAPTGKTVESSHTTVFRMANGKIAEEWVEYDMLSLLKKAGLERAWCAAASD